MPHGKVAKITINAKWCKGCGICVKFCPPQVLKLGPQKKPEVTNLEQCLDCHLCELRCPDLAIAVLEEEQEVAAS
ncbi:MAG TPA: 4Fe-4S binding protein [Firmicutes bacterium]|nr:2-oxoglutarate ferredoxin oxidoreductase subunit delta [Bacillota bacterium]HHV57309.1 4Fe-4S binding protein [Bacillota bacterium]